MSWLRSLALAIAAIRSVGAVSKAARCTLVFTIAGRPLTQPLARRTQ